MAVNRDQLDAKGNGILTTGQVVGPPGAVVVQRQRIEAAFRTGYGRKRLNSNMRRTTRGKLSEFQKGKGCRLGSKRKKESGREGRKANPRPRQAMESCPLRARLLEART